MEIIGEMEEDRKGEGGKRRGQDGKKKRGRELLKFTE